MARNSTYASIAKTRVGKRVFSILDKYIGDSSISDRELLSILGKFSQAVSTGHAVSKCSHERKDSEELILLARKGPAFRDFIKDTLYWEICATAMRNEV